MSTPIHDQDPFPDWLFEPGSHVSQDIVLAMATYSQVLIISLNWSNPLADGTSQDFAAWYSQAFHPVTLDLVACLTHHERSQWKRLRDPGLRAFHRRQAQELQKRLAASPMPDWVLKTLLGARKSARGVFNLRKKQ